MEKAILKTLIYADLFDYPMLSHEVHKWLVGKVASIEQVEKVLKKMVKNKRINYREGMFFLRGRKELVQKRLEKEVVSQKLYQKAIWIGRFLKIIPWIQLVGISGSLAMRNADEWSDIDLFVITRTRRVWLTRFVSALLLEFFGQRRRREDNKKNSAGKICLNLLISEDVLEQKKYTLYLAHEVLQVKVLWERNKTYQKFLEANEWTGKFLPNWIGMSAVKKQISKGISNQSVTPWVDRLEKVIEILQRRYMGKMSGNETVDHQVLYFHPEDAGSWVMKEYQKRIIKYKV